MASVCPTLCVKLRVQNPNFAERKAIHSSTTLHTWLNPVHLTMFDAVAHCSNCLCCNLGVVR